MTPAAGHPEVERYLERVRSLLSGMTQAETDEILLELRGHISERLAGGRDVDGTLRSLGDPTAIAREYRADRVAAKAECGGSPLAILHSLILQRRGLVGWATVGLAAFGYAWAIALGAAAIEKILSPRDVGLWHRPGSLSIPRLTVDGPGPPGTHELLGWWFVPLGFAACFVLLDLTKRFALWRIRRARGASRGSGTLLAEGR